MLAFIKNYINKITSKSTDANYPIIQQRHPPPPQLKMYDLSGADKVLVVVSLNVGNLPKSRAEQHCEEFKQKLYSNSVFSNKELYSILIIPVRESHPTTMELYSVPR